MPWPTQPPEGEDKQRWTQLPHPGALLPLPLPHTHRWMQAVLCLQSTVPRTQDRVAKCGQRPSGCLVTPRSKHMLAQHSLPTFVVGKRVGWHPTSGGAGPPAPSPSLLQLPPCPRRRGWCTAATRGQRWQPLASVPMPRREALLVGFSKAGGTHHRPPWPRPLLLPVPYLTSTQVHPRVVPPCTLVVAARVGPVVACPLRQRVPVLGREERLEMVVLAAVGAQALTALAPLQWVTATTRCQPHRHPWVAQLRGHHLPPACRLGIGPGQHGRFASSKWARAVQPVASAASGASWAGW